MLRQVVVAHADDGLARLPGRSQLPQGPGHLILADPAAGHGALAPHGVGAVFAGVQGQQAETAQVGGVGKPAALLPRRGDVERVRQVIAQLRVDLPEFRRGAGPRFLRCAAGIVPGAAVVDVVVAGDHRHLHAAALLKRQKVLRQLGVGQVFPVPGQVPRDEQVLQAARFGLFLQRGQRGEQHPFRVQVRHGLVGFSLREGFISVPDQLLRIQVRVGEHADGDFALPGGPHGRVKGDAQRRQQRREEQRGAGFRRFSRFVPLLCRHTSISSFVFCASALRSIKSASTSLGSRGYLNQNRAPR